MDPLSLAAGGMGAIGSLFSGITSLIGGQAQEHALEDQAAQARREAGVRSSMALQEGQQQIAQGAIHAAAGGGGFTGSTMGVLGMLGNQAYYNARAAVYKGMTEARNDMYQAKMAGVRGLQGAVGGLIGAGGQALGGFGMSQALGTQMNLIKQIAGGDSGGGGDPAAIEFPGLSGGG